MSATQSIEPNTAERDSELLASAPLEPRERPGTQQQFSVGKAPFSVAVRRVEGMPLCALRVWLRGGMLAEDIPGEACITGRMLGEGSARRSWLDIAGDVEDRGAALSTFGSVEGHGLSIDALAGDWRWALDLASELLFEPAFEPERLRFQAEQTMAELQSLADQPDVRTGWAFLDQIYRPHPLSRPTLGSVAGLAALTEEQCRSFHERALAERGMVLSFAGQFDEHEVARAIEGAFGSPRTGPRWSPPAVEIVGGDRRQVLEIPGVTQVHLLIGCPTIDRADPRLPALEVLGTVLGAGDGLRGRIPQRVREDEGLCYSVRVDAASGAGTATGRFIVALGTSASGAVTAEAAITEELALMREYGPSEVEVEEAIAYLLGREAFRRETARQWSDLLAEAHFFAQPVDDLEWRRSRLAGVTPESVRAVARECLPERGLYVTLGGACAASGSS